MKKLIIEKLIIISQSKNKAKIIEFDSTLTILKSQSPEGKSINRTGKSFVMKSLFYAFGADLKRYTVNWDEMKVCTIVYFSLDGSHFKMYRNDAKTIIIDAFNNTYKYETIGELREHFIKLFDFNIKLISRNSTQATPLYPGAIFMPFYIDQDVGWNGEWDSFKDIYQSNWKQEILLFHMGAKPNRYYQLLDEQAALSNENSENKTKFKLLGNFYENQIIRNANFLDINVKTENFKDEIDCLTDELNKHLEVKNALKADMMDCFNKTIELEILYKNARINLSELVEDIEYINENISEEHVSCPTCGTIHDNSISNRFMMFTEIEKCNSAIDSYFEEKKLLEKKIKLNESKIDTLSQYIDNINAILHKTRSNVSFEEIIKSEGAKSVMSDLKLDLSSLNTEIEKIDGRLKAITKEKSQITKNGKTIVSEYTSTLKDNLLYLDVNDIDLSKLFKFESTLKCGGNDTPTAILAQVFTLHKIASKYSNSVVSPIVLDAIFQQEPAKDKISLIWDFIDKKQPKGSQLIISTTEMHDAIPKGKIITLLNQRALLNLEDYKQVEIEANMFKSILLS